MLSEIRGERGELRIVNQVAASLGAWKVVPGDAPGTRTVTATCQSVNTFLVAQGPDVLVLYVGGRPTRWHITALEIGGGQLRGILIGAPEVR